MLMKAEGSRTAPPSPSKLSFTGLGLKKKEKRKANTAQHNGRACFNFLPWNTIFCSFSLHE